MRGHSHGAGRGTFAAAAALLVVLAAGCDSPSGIRVPGNDGEEPALQAVLVTPDGQTLQAGATRQYQAAGILSDGDTTDVTVAWSATGGTITTGGLYTAGQTAGSFIVVATAQDGLADTVAVTVTVPSTSPTLIGVLVTPPSTTVAAGGAVQFAAVGQLSNGATQAVNVTWTATGGTISGGGLYTAGAGAGNFRVIATGPGGLADTSAVTVTAAGSPAAYTRLVGDDWRYAGKDQLRAANLFWWFRSGDVYQYVDLVPDATFGQVARITFQQSDETGYAPKIDKDLPQPLDRMWFRWRMRYSPGWTTAGPLPSGYANSYKVAFWLWETYNGRGAMELSNTTQYIPGWGVQDPASGQFIQYAETKLPGTQDFGYVTTEWTDNQWYEFVAYYEKTGPTTARQHWWRRRLTNNGVVANNPWIYAGISVSGATTPRVRGITLGANRNKNNPTTMYIYWGPWEVVDGSRYPNPFGMPNLP
jgi:hypothetical protein